MTTYIGTSLKRFEDPRLLQGQGTFVDDLQLPDMLHAAVLRSPHAHARITSIDTAAVRALPGVVTVLTAEDIADAVGTIPPRHTPELEGKPVPQHPVLTQGKVCYVGQPVAVVVAHDRYQAGDALERFQVTYEPLQPILDPRAAAQDDVLLHEAFGSNVMMRLQLGRGDVPAAFAQAEAIVRGRYEVPRLAPAPLECRGVVAHYEPAMQRLTLWTSTQVPHKVKRYLGEILRQPPQELRVIAPDVGGGFGQKVEIWPEEAVCSYLAMRLGQPLKWIETRRENMLAYHGRGYSADVEAAVRRDGTILGLRFRILADVGAYFLNATSGPPVNAAQRVAGPYAIPAMHVECLSVLTNKPSTGPYRGAGGPEGAYFMERTIDRIAHELGLDPAEVRHRNFIAPDAFPYTTATGLTYDSGNFSLALDHALELAEYPRVRQEQRHRQSTEPLLGVGIATVVKASGGRGEMKNSQALVRVQPSGQVQIYTEVSPHGQGTATTFAQIAADTLGIRPEDVQVLHGDTTLLPSGQGTFASRGLSVGGSAMYAGLQQAHQAMARLAAHLLDCWVEDVVFQEGKVFNDRNPTQVMTFAEVAAAAQQHDKLPPELATGLEFPVNFTLRDNPYGFGVHVAVVEVDRQTGALHILRYVAVHDCGRVINPKLLEGQIYGAIAQGLGQALGEAMHYSEAGQPLTGSLLDYPLPHAKDLLELRIATLPTLSPTNALGLKGIGELPTVAAPVALVNAAIDALSGANVPHIDAPLTTEKLWRALHESRTER
jgi:carbon-monoxide dehydrogenase large subunit